MKKLLLTLLLAISGLFANAQLVTYQDWKVENAGQWSSFCWGVSRTQYPDYSGRYYYYVYFYSNSFLNTKYRDGFNWDKAITYIGAVNIYMEEYSGGRKINTVSVSSPYIICDWAINQNQYAAYFWSYQPYNRFYVNYGKVSSYDRSNY